MGIVITFFVLISILFLLSIVHYFLRKREFELNTIGTLNRINLVLKYVIASDFIILLIFFCIHIYDFTKNPDSLYEILLVNISFIFLLCSPIVFYNSLRLTPKYVIELDYPSRTKSKRGTIKLGKIMSKSKSKYNFFLNISDLAQHMFVCGITGTGKSNTFSPLSKPNLALEHTPIHFFAFHLSGDHPIGLANLKIKNIQIETVMRKAISPIIFILSLIRCLIKL